MSPVEIKIFAGVSIVIGAITWFSLFFLKGFEVISFDSFSSIGIGISVTSLFWLYYFNWGWKQNLVGKILYKPNVNGTWIGEFESDWKNEQGQVNAPGRFVLVIRQHWFSISVRAFTKLQKTESYAEMLYVDDSKGTKLLVYLFSEKSLGAGDHGARQGAAELDLMEDGKKESFEGHFWTQAGTRGYIKVRKISDNYTDSFNQACNKWQPDCLWKSTEPV